MFETFLAVPLHFTVEFLGFLVCTGGAFLVMTRPSLIPGPASNRVIAALGLGVIAAAEVAHGGSFLPLDGDKVLIAAHSVGLVLLALALASSVRPESTGAGAFLGFPIKQPLALAAAGAAAFLCLVALLGAARGKISALYRLAAAAFLLGAAAVITALAPNVEFGTGSFRNYSYAAHGARGLGFLLLGSWLWTGVRSSIRVRFVASFAGLLIVVVLVLSSSLTGVITQNVEEEQLDSISSQLDGVLTEFREGDTNELASAASSIAADDEIESLVDAGAKGGRRLKREADRITDAREEEIAFVAFVGPSKELLAFSGKGPAASRGGEIVQPRLETLELAGMVQSPVVQAVKAGNQSSANPVLISNSKPNAPDFVVILAASRVRRPTDGGGISGIAIVGRYIDAFALQRISNSFAPARASLIVDREVVASDLPSSTASKLKIPPSAAAQLRTDGTAALQQPLGPRSYFSAFAPLQTLEQNPLADTIVVLSSPARIVSSTRDEVTRILFLVAMGIGAVVLVLAWLSGRRITRPIQRLTAAAGAVREGDLTARAQVSGEDEVGRLGETFNDMTAALLRNTTDLKEAALEEQRLRARIETIIQSMADGLVAVDANKKILAFNPQAEELTGIKAKSAMGKQIDRVLDARDSNGTKLTLPIYDLAEGSLDGIYLVRKGTDPVPIALDSAVLRNEEGETAGGVAVIRDMTREREIERMKSEFLSNISHELRTPLTPIKGYAEILGSKTIPAEKTKQFAGGILESTARLERIVELLVDFAALEAGRLAPRTKPVNVGELVEELGEKLRKRAGRHEVVVEIGARLPKVIGDERLLRRSLEEVLDNAVKFSPQGGTIRLEVKGAAQNGKRRRAVAVTISDEGIGIAEEDVAKIFSDFHQLDGSETRTYGGLGLGLAFVRRIVEAHEGSVEVDSEPDRGTRLTITIPTAQKTRGA
ncbi:MAG: cell wall metabolism sensor histidine kinase WalK [Actinomycetota bacterium]|nr:cell wall metabolism sensor histidine kinase WalK [Actinomycetota bacterium]